MDFEELKCKLTRLWTNAELRYTQVEPDTEQSNDLSTPKHLACVFEVEVRALDQKLFPQLAKTNPPSPSVRVTLRQPYVRYLRCGPMYVEGSVLAGTMRQFHYKNMEEVFQELVSQMVWVQSDAYRQEMEDKLRVRAELLACPVAEEVDVLVHAVRERMEKVVLGLPDAEQMGLVKRQLMSLISQSKGWAVAVEEDSQRSNEAI